MGRKRQTRELFVAMNGRLVGTLARASNGILRFQYDQSWLDDTEATPISLSLPLSADPHAGDTISSFFDNLLPDHETIRKRMQVALGAPSTQVFDLLASAGADCVGALQLFSAARMPNVRIVKATPVSHAEIAAILRDYRSNPLGMTPKKDGFRISIAGAQEKTAFLWYQDRWQRPQGPTPTTHVFKLPIGHIQEHGLDLADSVENEWLCLRLASAFGFRVPHAEIRRFDDVKVLVVERFDRIWSKNGRWIVRVPQEDACQALGRSPAVKYEADGGPGVTEIMDLLLQSADSQADRREFLRANVFFWLLAAIDGHAKNFSLFLYPRGLCALAPLYDIVSAHPLVARKNLHASKLRMAMSVRGTRGRQYAWERIERRHWLATAKEARFSAREAEGLLEELASKVDDAVSDVARSLPEEFPEEVSGPVFEGVTKAGRRLTT